MSGPATAADIGARVRAEWAVIATHGEPGEKVEPRFAIVEEGAA